MADSPETRDIPEPPADMFSAAVPDEDRIEQLFADGGSAEGSVVGSSAVVRARSQTGEREPDAYQRYVAYFGVGGHPPWCAYFVSWCFDTCEVCDHNRSLPWGRFGSIGYTGSIHQWALATNKVVAVPQHGDIYGRSDEGHVGMVVGADGNEIYTINGNWGDAVGYATWVKAGSVWRAGASSSGLWFARW
jgi:hypothetical protein